MVSDEELEQMLDSGQSEVFVSNVSGYSQPPSAGPPILSKPCPFLTEGILRPRRERIYMLRVTQQGPGPVLGQWAVPELSRNF